MSGTNINFVGIMACSCGEDLCNEQGCCVKCGKQRMLPRELYEKFDKVKEDLNSLHDEIIEWINKNNEHRTNNQTS